jgi:hypothetical protein
MTVVYRLPEINSCGSASANPPASEVLSNVSFKHRGYDDPHSARFFKESLEPSITCGKQEPKALVRMVEALKTNSI